MYRMGVVAAAVAAGWLAATPASASVAIWTVSGEFTTPVVAVVPSLASGGTFRPATATTRSAGVLSGVFTTDDSGGRVQVTDVDLIVSASGDFTQFEYDTAMIDAQMDDADGDLQYFRLTDPTGLHQLELWFGTDFDQGAAGPVAFSGYDQNSSAGGHRDLTGFATPGPVPEPQVWTLLVGGFLALGSALRRRRWTSPA